MKRMRLPAFIMATLFLFGSGCGDGQSVDQQVDEAGSPEAVSLLGEPLFPAPFDADRLEKLRGDYAEAQATLEAHPDNPDSWIWLGRRAGYLWQYREAIDIFSEGIEQFPDDARLYRHRGHRYITVREFDRAVADLERAAQLIQGTEDEVEPDGAPNPAGIPTSTLHTNIWYHLGLAYYLKADFSAAVEAFRKCLAASGNNDMMVATVDWLYMSLQRDGRAEEAEALLEMVDTDLELLENHAYYKRVLMYKGYVETQELLNPEEGDDRALNLATQGYGVGNWYLYNGDTLQAVSIFKDVLRGDYWPAFGYIAAEADVVLLGESQDAVEKVE